MLGKGGWSVSIGFIRNVSISSFDQVVTAKEIGNAVHLSYVESENLASWERGNILGCYKKIAALIKHLLVPLHYKMWLLKWCIYWKNGLILSLSFLQIDNATNVKEHRIFFSIHSSWQLDFTAALRLLTYKVLMQSSLSLEKIYLWHYTDVGY